MGVHPSSAVAGERVVAGLELIRALSLDGRTVFTASVATFLDSLFEQAPCPQLGQFAFWTTPDGSQWLFVEREVSQDGEKAYVIGRGDMGANADEVTLSGLGVVNEKAKGRKVTKTFNTAALFVDSGGADAAAALKLEKALAEGEFCSHVRTDLWARAVRFTSFKDEGGTDGAAPPADGDASLPPVETVVEEDAGDGTQTDDVDTDGDPDDPFVMMGQMAVPAHVPSIGTTD